MVGRSSAEPKHFPHSALSTINSPTINFSKAPLGDFTRLYAILPAPTPLSDRLSDRLKSPKRALLTPFFILPSTFCILIDPTPHAPNFRIQRPRAPGLGGFCCSRLTAHRPIDCQRTSALSPSKGLPALPCRQHVRSLLTAHRLQLTFPFSGSFLLSPTAHCLPLTR